MKRLEIQPYCENCPDFEPIVNTVSITYLDDGHIGLKAIQTISCEHSERCRHIANFIRQEIVKNDKN